MTSSLKRSRENPVLSFIRFALLTLTITATPNVVHGDEIGRYIQSGLESVASSIVVLAIMIASAGFMIAVAIYVSGKTGRSDSGDSDSQ